MITNSNNAIFECYQIASSWEIGDHFYSFYNLQGNSSGENYIVNTNNLTQEEIEAGERRFDITETVDGWLYKGITNNGLLLKVTNDAGGYFYGLNAAEQYAVRKLKLNGR